MNDKITLATEDTNGFMDYSYQHFCDLNGVDWCEGMPKQHILNWSTWMTQSGQQYCDKIYLQAKGTTGLTPFDKGWKRDE